ncbi:hypothetical protein [uncultured Thalassospira sp.]|uniref:hypothetical protein n=1 Tax=uncultured Thalassospira sp. TaxID=404382 RepID=UPI00258F8BCB|nr:hypothetical protein [uncultured Thalassospira sp.]
MVEEFERAREVSEQIGSAEQFSEILKHYLDAISRCEKVINLKKKGEHDSKSIILQNFRVLRQNTLRRSVALTSASFQMIESQNVLGLALNCRAHIESTCQLGYYCAVVDSFLNGRTTYEHLYKKFVRALAGASHEIFSHAPDPVNVLYFLDKSERYFLSLVGEGADVDFRDKYDFLSDFCHPNFCSSIIGVNLDKDESSLVYEDFSIDKKNSLLIDYLALMSMIVIFFDNQFSALFEKLEGYSNWPLIDFGKS